MIGTSLDLKPPDWERLLEVGTREAILRKTWQELSRRCPALAALNGHASTMTPAGGVIFAWGNTDIHDANSRLHTRHEIGVDSAGNYHTVNTGKYTMGLYLGYAIAERIAGTSS